MKRKFAILAQVFAFTRMDQARGLECLGLLAPREVAMKKILAHGFALVSAPSVIMYYQRACGLHRRRC
jgi:hypothetical protein